MIDFLATIFLSPISLFAFNPFGCLVGAAVFGIAALALPLSSGRRVFCVVTMFVWIAFALLEAKTPIQTNIRTDLVLFGPLIVLLTIACIVAIFTNDFGAHSAADNADYAAQIEHTLTPRTGRLRMRFVPPQWLIVWPLAIAGLLAFAAPIYVKMSQRSADTRSASVERHPASSVANVGFDPIPFTIDSFNKSDFALEAKISGTIAMQTGRIVIRPSTPLMVRRAFGCTNDPRCDEVLSGVSFLLSVDGEKSFHTLGQSKSIDPNLRIPTDATTASVALPNEIAFAITSAPNGPLKPAIANARLRIQLSQPGDYTDSNGKTVRMREYASNYADAPAELFASATLGQSGADFCTRADTIAHAAEFGCNDRLKELLASDASGINDISPNGCTVLAIAISNKHREAALVLLDAKANPSPQSGNCNEPLWLAISDNDLALVKALLTHGADPGTRARDEYAPLSSAVNKGNIDIVTALLDAGAQPNVLSPKNYSALALAVRANRRDLVELLLRKGANPNMPFPNASPFNDGRNVLWWATKASHVEVLDVLLEYKANPMQSTPNGFNEVLEAAAQPGLDALKVMLQHGTNINVPAEKDYFKDVTPFMNTAVRGRVVDMQEMIQLGANPEALDYRGHDAIYWADHFGRKENAGWLRARKATK